MNILILGANGHSAREIIPCLLELADVELTLFLRNAGRVRDLQHPRVRTVEGDANNPDDLRAALHGQDMVVNTMGGMDLDEKTKILVSAMEESGVQRLVAINAGGIYDELPEPFNSWDKKMVGFTRPINLKTADLIEQSTLNYTILRPVWLTDKPTEEYQLTQKGETYRGTETSRASIGKLVAEIAQDPTIHSRANLGISQVGTDGDRPRAYR